MSYEAHQPMASQTLRTSEDKDHQSEPMMKKTKLRTAKDVMDRLRWENPSASRSIMIGYDDRINGPMEISFQKFQSIKNGGDIPEHRILYFRNVEASSSDSRGYGEIVWDRAGRVDKIFTPEGDLRGDVSAETETAALQAVATMTRLAAKEKETLFLMERALLAKANRCEMAKAALENIKREEHTGSGRKQASKTTPVHTGSPSQSESGNDRKRHFEDASHKPEPCVSTSTMDTIPPETIQRLRLEAIFHPKFENENRNDQSVREQMKQRVASHSGYLEVTLKHSGSLLLWSGQQRYYSKNSTDNRFTAVGEILLRQHFVRSFWNDAIDATADKGMKNLMQERMYKACSDFVESNRLTLAFEVVTSVLGDHGARPKRDFLILTAVADRSSERFYSTSELVEFAHQFRLPHNDSWVFASPQSVDDLFASYDSSRERGLASGVVASLSQAAEAQVASLYPHIDFQGEIIEGLVIRYVSYRDRLTMLRTIQRLSRTSKDLTEKVPPSLPNCVELILSKSDPFSLVLRTDVRSLFHESAKNQTHSTAAFERLLQSTLSLGEVRRKMNRVSRSESIDIPALARELENSENRETQRIAKLISTLTGINARVDYSVMEESIENGDSSESRWLFMLHVIHDATFPKFQRNMSEGDMPLFRGFAVELCNDQTSSLKQTLLGVSERSESSQNSDGELLMLKMKFLPYMVRTFGCRNGLRSLRQGGSESFVQYTNSMLTKWQVSKDAKDTWGPFFKAWAMYAKDWLAARPIGEANKCFPLLNDFNYLDHLERFLEMYESGLFAAATETATKSSLSGLTVVVAPDRSISRVVADFIAHELGGAARIDDLNRITVDKLADMCAPGLGAVCSAVVADGIGQLRRLTKDHADSISLVFFQCSEEGIRSLFLPEKEIKKTMGMLNGWRKTICSYKVELSRSSLIDVEPMETDEGCRLMPSENFIEVLSRLRTAAVDAADESAGALLFFPGIPGCGKSSLTCTEVQGELQSSLKQRNHPCELIVKVGDQTRGKFWQVVKHERAKRKASLYIVDKNVPASTWETVADVCGSTNAVGIPVLPDAVSLATTRVKGLRRPDGAIVEEKVHVYPFSLRYLALCMARVLSRTPSSHIGKLDRGTKRACMVVIKFFCLYRRIASHELLDSISAKFNTVGATVSPITVSVLKSSSKSLPGDLESLLMEALRAQFGYDLARGSSDTTKTNDSYLDALEDQLRQSIDTHLAAIYDMAADEQISRGMFVKGFLDRIAQLDSVEPKASILTNCFPPTPSFYKIASFDVDVDEVHKVVLKVAKDARLSVLMEAIVGSRSAANVWTGRSSVNADLIRNTHVTMLHCEETTQEEMEAAFGALCGCRGTIQVVGLLWSPTVAALAVALPEKTECGYDVPACRNEFAHITIWCATGQETKAANDLPHLAANGSATRVDFARCFPLVGTIALWSDRKTSKGIEEK